MFPLNPYAGRCLSCLHDMSGPAPAPCTDLRHLAADYDRARRRYSAAVREDMARTIKEPRDPVDDGA